LTEAASIASARVMGRGDEHLADQAAVDAMRKAFNQLNIRGTIVIGEGERDEAPMLYIGEKVGRATRPIRGRHRARSARGHDHHGDRRAECAERDRDGRQREPAQRADTYMDKIAVGRAPKARSTSRRARRRTCARSPIGRASMLMISR